MEMTPGDQPRIDGMFNSINKARQEIMETAIEWALERRADVLERFGMRTLVFGAMSGAFETVMPQSKWFRLRVRLLEWRHPFKAVVTKMCRRKVLSAAKSLGMTKNQLQAAMLIFLARLSDEYIEKAETEEFRRKAMHHGRAVIDEIVHLWSLDHPGKIDEIMRGASAPLMQMLREALNIPEDATVVGGSTDPANPTIVVFDSISKENYEAK